MPDREAPPLIVLVHGTFARDAAWTRPSTSSFCARLRKTLGGKLKFAAFQWSGANRHAARIKAGDRLAHHLQNHLARHPTRRVFVIGHSHGGTVITHALRDRPRLAHALSGVIFLSTPFIQVRRRPHATALAGFLALAGLLGLIWLMQQVTNWLRSGGQSDWVVAPTNLFLFVGGLWALLYMTFDSQPIGGGNEKKVPLRAESAADRLREAFAVRHLHRERTLFLRTNADEASAALAWIQAMSRLLGDIVAAPLQYLRAMLPWMVAERGQDWRDYGIARACAHLIGFALVLYLFVLFVGLIIFLVAGILTLAADLVGVDLRPVISRPIAVLTQARDGVNTLISWTFGVLMLGVSVLVVIAGILLSLFNRAFGQWSVWAALFVEISVEAAPPGRWTLRQLEPPDQTRVWSTGSRVALTHSLSYEDPRAHLIVAAWIRRRLAASRRNAPAALEHS